MNLPRRKRIRLDQSLYARAGMICSITLAVRDRQRVFADPALAASARDQLVMQARCTQVAVYAYCIMPDHVHLVLGPSESCDIIRFVAEYKGLVLRAAWRRGIVGSFWQRRFWDHFLRAEESLEEVVAYVLCNPVRAGLVEDWVEYPFCGSMVLDVGGGTEAAAHEGPVPRAQPTRGLSRVPRTRGLSRARSTRGCPTAIVPRTSHVGSR